jgi:hypothetical protein
MYIYTYIYIYIYILDDEDEEPEPSSGVFENKAPSNDYTPLTNDVIEISPHLQGNVKAWFTNAVLAIGAPLGLGETASARKVIIFETEVILSISLFLFFMKKNIIPNEK